MKRTPGPSIFSLLWNLKKFRADPLSFSQELVNKYQDVLKIQLGVMKIFAFNHPRFFHYFLRQNYKDYPKSNEYKKISAIMGEGLTTSEGQFWQQNRKVIQPFFTKTKIESYFKKLDQVTCSHVKTYKEEVYDFREDSMKYALSTITQVLFHKDYSHESERVSSALKDFMAITEDRIFQIIPFADKLPTKKNRKYKQINKFLRGLVQSIIDKKKDKNYANATDLVSLLLRTQEDKSKKGITNKYLIDEVMTFFIAGHETTASSITWLLYTLVAYPTYLKELQKQIDQRLPSNFTLEELNSISLLDQLLNESLRLYPPLWMNSRKALKNDIVEGHKIKKGNLIVLSPYYLQRDKRFWEEPNQFRPERFKEENLHKITKDTFQPFGIGPRACIGELFARMEIKVFVVRLLQEFNLQLVPGQTIIPEPSITMRPKNGVKIKLSRRKNASSI